MRNLYDTFSTSQELEKEGVWLDYDGPRLKIARAGGANKRYLALLDTRMRPYRQQLQRGTLSEEKGNEILLEVFAETVVLDWEGVLDRQGNPMAFSRDNVIKLFTDLPDFYADVRAAASEIANFRQEGITDDAKKSPSGSSDGSPSDSTMN